MIRSSDLLKVQSPYDKLFIYTVNSSVIAAELWNIQLFMSAHILVKNNFDLHKIRIDIINH